MKLVFFGWLLLAGSLSLAQSTRTDIIHKLDRSTVNVKIDELTDTDILYVDPSAPKEKKTIPRSQVWKIVFSDGSTETITPQAGQQTNDRANASNKIPGGNVDGGQAISSPKRASANDYPAPSPSASYTDPAAFARIHLTVGPEIALFSQSGTARWSNQYSGLGMNQSIGASLRLDYRFIKAVAISVTGGYSQWELVRNYLQNNTEKYDETIQLTRIPVQAGFKLYPWRSLYLLPEAGVNLLTSSVKTSGTHPSPTDVKSSTTPITYGASLGYEFRMGGLLIDLSGRYQILDVQNLNFGAIAPALTEKVQFGSLRIGIGFNAFRK